MRHLRYRHQAGFTIVELMISTAVFSIVLLIVAAGVLSFTREYQKGIINNRTQTVGNTILSQVAHDIQFSNTPSNTPVNNGDYYCLQIGGSLYVYQLGAQLESAASPAHHQATHGLVVVPASNGSCTTAGIVLTPTVAAGISGAHELLDQHMRLGDFTITTGAGLYNIDISLIYGDDDLLSPAIGSSPINWLNEQCSGNTGDEFCSKVTLHTVVAQRI